MDPESCTVFMQNLEEYVFDESKVVTCKWLSSTFSLHINAVRQLINKFSEKESVKKHANSLRKTYYVSGVLKDHKGFISSVVKEEDLSSFKETLNVVLSEHLYSIQKGGPSQDLALLCVANQHEDSCKGMIKNDSITRRSAEELGNLRVVAYPKSNNVQSSHSVNNTKPNSKPSSIFSSNKEQSKVKDVQSNVEIKKEIVEEKPPASEVSNNKTTKKNTGIAGFFSKQSSNLKIKTENIKKEPKATESDVKKVESNVHSSDVKKEKLSPMKNSIKKEQVSTVKTTEIAAKVSEPENDSKSNKTKMSKGTSKKMVNNKKDTGKKRKRIQTLESDSEDETKEVDVDDIFTSDSPERIEKPQLSDDEDIIPPTPEVKVNKAPLNPRKRKKVVDKTFMDENGYIITKKEEVYESCSDVEEECDPKIENIPVNNLKSKPKVQNKKQPADDSPPKGKKKKASPPQRGKQQSLMSFFKKV